MSPTELELRFEAFSSEVEAYAEATFPGGTVNLDQHDDNLSPLPSLDDYLSTVLVDLELQYVASNQAATELALQASRDAWNETVTTTIDAAIRQAMADLIGGLDNAEFPYLDEAAFSTIEAEFAAVAESIGNRKIDGADCGAEDQCQDIEEDFFIKNRPRTCKWLKKQIKRQGAEKACRRKAKADTSADAVSVKAEEFCPMSCGVC